MSSDHKFSGMENQSLRKGNDFQKKKEIIFMDILHVIMFNMTYSFPLKANICIPLCFLNFFQSLCIYYHFYLDMF